MMEMRYVELNEICDVRDGTHDSPKYVQEGFPLVTSKNIIDGKLDLSTVNYLTQKDYDKINERSKVDRGDIIMPMIGTIGNPLLIGDFYKFAIKNVALIKFPNKNISNRYIWYFLKSDAFNKYVAEKNRGGTQKFLSLNDIRRMKVPYISYFEQISVVEKLDMVYKVIMQRIKELQLLDDLIKARFVEMFGDPVLNEKGWKTKPLLDMGKCKNGMNFHYDDSGVEINCLGVGDFKDLSVIDNTEQLPTVSLNEMPSEEYLLKDDDIVFVRSNGNKALVGRSVAVYPGDIPTTFSGFCIRYRKYDNAVTIPYLLRVLKADSIRKKMAGRGANIQNLNQQILGTLVIPVPPIELQMEFSDFVKQVDKSKFEGRMIIIGHR